MNRSLPIVVMLLALLFSGCASKKNDFDPLKPANQITDSVNDSLDRVTLKPIAQTYTNSVPRPVRRAVSNFYENTTYLNTVLNDFLQGKGRQGFEDLMRFLINSTLGIAGLADVATSMGLERHQEDFGQTLATWGVEQGAYIVYPVLGPNSARNTPDFITATATDPLFWASLALAPVVTIPLAVMKYVDKRAQLLDASDMRDELALDPYTFTREAWKQNREYKIHDGNPPRKESSADDDWEEEEWSDAEEVAEKASQPKIRIRMESMTARQTGTGEFAVAQDDPGALAASAQTAVELAQLSDKAKPSASAKLSDKPEMFMINLSSHYSEMEAAAMQGRLERVGILCEIIRVSIDGKTWYRVRTTGRYHQALVQGKMAELKEKSGLDSIWMEAVKD